MGGSNEKPLTTRKASAEKSLSKDARIHEDAGFVHLHEGGPADKTKLKVAIPSYVFHDRLTQWVASGMVQPLIFIDHNNNSRCVVSQKLENSGSDLNVDMVWDKINVVGNLKSLMDHAEAR